MKLIKDTFNGKPGYHVEVDGGRRIGYVYKFTRGYDHTVKQGGRNIRTGGRTIDTYWNAVDSEGFYLNRHGERSSFPPFGEHTRKAAVKNLLIHRGDL